VLDQSNLINVSGGFGSYSINELNSMAQTFTVGKAGFLTQIDLQILRFGTNVTHDLIFSVTAPTNSNFPVAAPALVSVTLHAADVPNVDGFNSTQAVTSIHLGLGALAVTPGQVLSLVLSSTEPFVLGNAYDWVVSSSTGADVYTRGEAWAKFNNTSFSHPASQPLDFGFRTFVMVPEPGAGAMMVLGGTAVLVRRRHRNLTSI
jgi:hypothetical protein